MSDAAELPPTTPEPDAAPPIDRAAELKAMPFGFAQLPLEHFRGLSALEIEAHEGIGPKTCQRIQALLAELDALEPPPAPVAEPMAAHGAHHAPQPAAEPTPSGGGGGLLLAFIVLVALIAFAVVATHRPGTSGAKLEAARATIVAQETALAALHDDGIEVALAHALKVNEAADAGNFGEALGHLENVERALAMVQRAATKASPDALSDEAEPDEPEPDDSAAPAPTKAAKPAKGLTAAKEAAAKARAALMLEQPQTKQDVKAACAALHEAVRALAPKSNEEVHGNAGGTPH